MAALNPKQENTQMVSASAAGPGRKTAWMIRPSALRGSALQDKEKELWEASSPTGPDHVSEADTAVSWPGDHSSKAVTLTGLLSACIILAGAICKRKEYTRSVREEV